jgi:hypothetical protein
MNKILPLSAFLFFFAACSNDAANEPKATDSISNTVITDELPEEEEIAPVAEVFTTLDSNFNTGSFYDSGTDSLRQARLAKIDSGSLKEFVPYLIYNADSSLAIDPYSYNYIIQERNGTRRISDAGPDVEIALIDVKQGTRRRIWFGGPSTAILDAKWKNKNELWLSGIESLDTAGFQPFILSIDIANKQVQRWQSDEIVKTEVNDVLRRKLEAQANAPKTNRVF